MTAHEKGYGVNRASPQLVSLLDGWEQQGDGDERAAWAARVLGLRGATSASRRFFLGDVVASRQDGAHHYWTLPEVVERMRAAYCGPLTAEIDGLPADQARWIAARLEEPQALPPQQQVQYPAVPQSSRVCM